MQAKIVSLYTGGSGNGKEMPIRAICQHLGKSYGFVHRMLTEAVSEGNLDAIRARGGAGRSKASQGASGPTETSETA